jgi:DNA repair ATPase RecN
MRITAKNFQKHEAFDLNIEGLTVLIGPSNQGKSSIFRAIKGLFRNDLPEGFIRTGQEGLEVTADIDSHKVVATRTTKGAARYEIDGVKFAKLAGKIPPELKALGMNEVKVGDFTLDPIFAKQNGKQFLLDTDSPMELNTILGAFASTEKLEVGKKSANLQISQKNAEAKALAEEIGEAETRKAELIDLTGGMEDIEHEFRRLEPEIYILETKSEWLRNAEHRQTYLWPLKHVVEKMEVPDLSEVIRLSAGYDYGVQATNSFRLAKFFGKTQTAIESTVHAMAEVNGIVETIESAHDVLKLHGKAAPAYQLVSDFSATIKRLEDGLSLIQTWQASIMYAGVILQSQETILSQRASTQRVEDELAEVRANLTAQETRAKAEEADKIACPMCGHKFHPGAC